MTIDFEQPSSSPSQTTPTEHASPSYSMSKAPRPILPRRGSISASTAYHALPWSGRNVSTTQHMLLESTSVTTNQRKEDKTVAKKVKKPVKGGKGKPC